MSEQRARTGEISGAEQDKIALEQRGFEREVDDAAVARREAVADLVPLLGIDVADVDAVGALALPPAPDDVEQLVRDALDRRPDLKAAASAAEAADAALRLAKATAWPDPTVGVQYAHSEFGVSGDLRDQIGGTLSMPLPWSSIATRATFSARRPGLPSQARSSTSYASACRTGGAHRRRASSAARGARASLRGCVPATGARGAQGGRDVVPGGGRSRPLELLEAGARLGRDGARLSRRAPRRPHGGV